jgi:hypothetical protein
MNSTKDELTDREAEARGDELSDRELEAIVAAGKAGGRDRDGGRRDPPPIPPPMF